MNPEQAWGQDDRVGLEMGGEDEDHDPVLAQVSPPDIDPSPKDGVKIRLDHYASLLITRSKTDG